MIIFAKIYVKILRTMKKTMVIKAVMLLMVGMLALTSCNKYKDIKVTSQKIESYKIDGFKAVDLGLALTVDNPAGKVEILELNGKLKHSGKVIGKIDVTPFILQPRKTDVYHLKLRFTLDSGFGFKDALSFLKFKDVLTAIKKRDVMALINTDFVDELLLDIHVAGKAAGIKIERDLLNVPVKKLYNR